MILRGNRRAVGFYTEDDFRPFLSDGLARSACDTGVPSFQLPDGRPAKVVSERPFGGAGGVDHGSSGGLPTIRVMASELVLLLVG